MRVLIIADMEGVIGIEQAEACNRRRPEYETGRQLLVDEVNRVAAAAREAGAAMVSVIDWHAGGGNLTSELLDGVQIVPEDFGPGYDVVLLTGYHAMAGAANAFIPHTMSQFVTLEMNGEPCGELALLSRWAGESDVKVALAVGDRAAMEESERYLPGTPTLAVKEAVSSERAVCVPPDAAYKQLHDAVVTALSRPDAWRSYRSDTPIDARFRLDPEPPMASKIPWVSRDADGWLACRVQSTKDVIDLIDVFRALR